MDTQKRFEEMCKMREDGKTIIEIAAHYGITKQAVSVFLRRHNKPLRLRASDADILSDTPENVAERFGFKRNTVIARLRSLGVPFPRKSYVTRRRWSLEKVMPMYQDYLNGTSQKEIAAKYGVHQATISTWFKYYNLETRSKGWPKGKPRGKRQK